MWSEREQKREEGSERERGIMGHLRGNKGEIESKRKDVINKETFFQDSLDINSI